MNNFSELNPELMQELMTLRNEHARLKEFASKREVDEVQRLEESRDDAARLSNRYKEQFFRTKSELEDTQQLLRESEDREAKLNDDVADWAKRYSALDEEMKEERLKSHKAAIDAERNFQNLKKSLIEKARQDLKDLEDKLTMKIDTERKQHKEKLDRVDAERNEIEKRLSQQLVELRDQSSAALRSSKEQAQKRIDEVELSKQAEIERVLKEKADELDALTNKGKGMLREAKKKASVIKQQLTEEYDAKLEALEEELEKVKSFQEDYEQKATAKIAKRDKQIQLLDARSREAARVNRELEEKAKKAERSSKELTGDNDRLRRQLGSRFGAGGASQPQMEQLMSAYNSLREENRKLKESNPDNGFLTNTVQSDSDTMHAPKQATGAINKSALIQYREEFEEQISVLEDEKRDLIMRNSAAMTDVQKAEQRSWELEEELAKVRSELTATKLSMQRNERRTDFSAGLSASSKKRHASSADLNKENATPNIHRRALPPSGAKPDFTPKVPDSRKKAATTVPTLMDYTSKDYKANTETQPECKQS